MEINNLSISSKPKPSFYRRPLPDNCIDFSSVEGKLIFREALLGGHMENYFHLASQFLTQEEPGNEIQH
jgi:glutathione gamma-glutamylcysteinyltransferase